MKKDMKKQDEQSEQTAQQPKQARRDLFGSGLAAASMMFGLVAAACSDDDGNSGGGTGVDAGGTGGNDAGGNPPRDGGVDATVPVVPDSGTAADNDIVPLNALLKAEHNAILAYTKGAELIAAAPMTDPLKSLATPITDIAVHFQSQHKEHRDALIAAIEKLGGKPIAEADAIKDFAAPAGLAAKPTINNVLKFAAGAERNAATAYNEVLSGLEAASLRFLATIIEGDESQHFIILTALIAGLAAPTGTTAANTAKFAPEAFVHSFDAKSGLDKAPADYWA